MAGFQQMLRQVRTDESRPTGHEKKSHNSDYTQTDVPPMLPIPLILLSCPPSCHPERFLRRTWP